MRMGTMRMGWSVPLLLLAGCGGTASDSGNGGIDNAIVAPEPAAPGPVASGVVSPTSAPSPAPSTSALPETPFAPDSGQAAADVVRRYHALIAAKRYDQAYRLWEPGAAGMSAQAFAASFAKYRDYHAEVGAPGRVDAGAGQRYVTVPVRAYGTLAAGGGFALEGPFILHRVADIDGSTAEQRSWRIRSSGLKPRPADAPAQGTIVARYRCIDGSRIAAMFDNEAGTVTLRRAGERLGVLRQQPTGSGIWYKGGGLDLRGKGDAATFSEPGKPPIACTAIR